MAQVDRVIRMMVRDEHAVDVRRGDAGSDQLAGDAASTIHENPLAGRLHELARPAPTGIGSGKACP